LQGFLGNCRVFCRLHRIILSQNKQLCGYSISWGVAGVKSTVRVKLLSAFLFIAILMGVTSGLAYAYMKKIDHDYSQLVQKQSQILVNATQMQYYADHQVSLLREYFLMKSPDDMSGIVADSKAMDQLVQQTKSLTQTQDIKDKLSQIQILSDDYAGQMTTMSTLSDGDAFVFATHQQLFEFGVNVKDKAHAIQVTAQANMNSQIQSTMQSTKTITNTILILAIIAIILAVGIALLVSNVISKPIRALSRVALRIAEGDLTSDQVHVKNRDEIGALATSFNDMAANLRALITKVHVSAEQVAASSEELTASAEQTSDATQSIALTMQELASGSERQATNLDETTKTVNEMTLSTQEIAKSTQRVSVSAQATAEVSATGKMSIETSVGQMKSIQTKVGDLAFAVKGLGEHSQEIGQIVSTITQIAEQTNLLALNAAIEAARAGDHGRGFAVVADEVRKLAEQSAQSAGRIEDLIGRIQGDTLRAVDMTDSTTHEVNAGIDAVNEAGDSFVKIQQAVGSLAEQIEHVSAAVQQMAAGAEQMSRSITDVSTVAEASASGAQNVSAAAEEQLATMEEVTASATSLAHMAQQLQETVSQFKV
jgi:methyl-accepting chemotaxis protein